MSFTQHLEHTRKEFFPFILPEIATTVTICTDATQFATEVGRIYDRVFPESERSFTTPPERREAVGRLRGQRDGTHREYLLLRDSQASAVGWLTGEMEDHETFYVRTVGIAPEYRHTGIPERFYPHFLEYLKALGYERVTSQHHPNNRAIIILQLRAGFSIEGFNIDERWGPQVKMVRYLHGDREAEFHRRFWLPEYSRSH
ncbi:GNAT family N-acetyltransferase [Streptomyces hokutonensis]|uniref:GNAT family N-acetyltransferase n=1 Tax=Streptomyces hokutonensis TaxID=1306990 RepID=UPI0038103269